MLTILALFFFAFVLGLAGLTLIVSAILGIGTRKRLAEANQRANDNAQQFNTAMALLEARSEGFTAMSEIAKQAIEEAGKVHFPVEARRNPGPMGDPLDADHIG